MKNHATTLDVFPEEWPFLEKNLRQLLQEVLQKKALLS